MLREGTLFVLVGPSGAGKNTLMKQVQAQFDDLPQLATMTTRPKRDGEHEGREHWFLSHAEFEALIKADALVEWQQVHLNDLYGTPRKAVDEALGAARDLIADIEFLGAARLRETYPDHTVLIFVTPSTLDILAGRIAQRGNITPEALADRLERARFEMTFAPQCDYLVLNDSLDAAVDTLRQIIQSERTRRKNITANLPPMRHVFHGTVTALIQQDNKLLVQAHSQALPAFPIQSYAQHPHETLRQGLQQALGCAILIQAVSDSRFDFVAPNHVTIASALPDVYLNFYYCCSLPSPVELPNWEWLPNSVLNLPFCANVV